MSVWLADAGIWPLIIFAIVAMLLGGGKKKTGRTSAPPSDGEGGGGLMSELNRALEELKRAEQEALRRRQGAGAGASGSQAELPPAPKSPQRRTTTATVTRGQAPSRAGAKGGELIKRQVFMPKPKPAARSVKRVAPPVEYDADQAFEDPTVISLERLDYDDEAEQLVQRRIKAAQQRDAAREDTSLEEMSAAQLARRADRAPAAAIGGQAEHDDWHRRRDAVVKQPAVKPAAPRLSRFGGTRIRDAIILSEILGRPVGER